MGLEDLKNPLTFPLSTQTYVFLEIKEDKRGFLSDDITQICCVFVIREIHDREENNFLLFAQPASPLVGAKCFPCGKGKKKNIN